MFGRVVQVREAGVVAALEQVARDDGLGGLVEDRLEALEVEVSAGGGDDAEAAVLAAVVAEQQRELLGGVDEGVEHEHLAVMALGHEVHVHVCAALHEERVGSIAHAVDRGEQVFDELDPGGLDPLELEVVHEGVLVAGSAGPERDERGRAHRGASRPARAGAAGALVGSAISSSSILQVAAISSSNSSAVKSAGSSRWRPRER